MAETRHTTPMEWDDVAIIIAAKLCYKAALLFVNLLSILQKIKTKKNNVNGPFRSTHSHANIHGRSAKFYLLCFNFDQFVNHFHI